jgi:anti-anti-sigma factor
MESSVSVDERESVVRVKLTGKVRVDAAALLKEKLAGVEKSKDVVLDWQEAEHVDASVLQVLLALKGLIEATGLSVMVERDNPHVREYLRLAGLAEHFQPLPIHSAEQETDRA